MQSLLCNLGGNILRCQHGRQVVELQINVLPPSIENIEVQDIFGNEAFGDPGGYREVMDAFSPLTVSHTVQPEENSLIQQPEEGGNVELRYQHGRQVVGQQRNVLPQSVEDIEVQDIFGNEAFGDPGGHREVVDAFSPLTVLNTFQPEENSSVQQTEQGGNVQLRYQLGRRIEDVQRHVLPPSIENIEVQDIFGNEAFGDPGGHREVVDAFSPLTVSNTVQPEEDNSVQELEQGENAQLSYQDGREAVNQQANYLPPTAEDSEVENIFRNAASIVHRGSHEVADAFSPLTVTNTTQSEDNDSSEQDVDWEEVWIIPEQAQDD
ncbi:uncharacterized protein [Watersipora subatra]|uniref:uncharacterized protein n=1 Tax=Watersipora subatra TaxID=2589382 RepID=UPI00355B8F2C